MVGQLLLGLKPRSLSLTLRPRRIRDVWATDRAPVEPRPDSALNEALRPGRERARIGITIRLAEIALDRGQGGEATRLLEVAQAHAADLQDRENLALVQPVVARLHALRGNIPAARASFAEAIDLFERLGMRRELAEARAALADLDAPAASAGSAAGADESTASIA